MKTIKLTDTERFRLRESYRHMADVLRPIKLKSLKGDALMDMKMLETAISNLECFLIGK